MFSLCISVFLFLLCAETERRLDPSGSNEQDRQDSWNSAYASISDRNFLHYV